jgi:hypothetical protein
LNERGLFQFESSINSSAPVSLQAHSATAAIKLAHGLAALPRHSIRMNEITLRRK